MPLVDDLEVWGDDARAALPPGEHLLALASVGVAYGARGGAEPDFWTNPVGRAAGRLARAVPTEGWVGKAVAGIGGFGVTVPSLDLPVDFPERWIGGRTCFGPAGSLARQVEAATTGYSFLAVTSRRVVVLVKDDERLREVWGAPRGDVVAARRRPRLLARGRFGLVFGDGSWIVLGTFGAHVGSAHAKRVVTALGTAG
ncbi:hypothetical protein [Saccharothrix xinjiangensis]|uniref:Uncharacterized protein n=1 Tax=Saccharothrix xinjiangensis TaxID=204798 RepID=A0ABV9YE99_9PSEU